MLDLSKLEELLKNAPIEELWIDPFIGLIRRGKGAGTVVAEVRTSANDANLIVAAVNAFPELIAELKTLRLKNENLKKRLDGETKALKLANEQELEWARNLDKVQDERDALCEQVEELGWETAPSSPLPMKLAGASDAAWHLERELADLAAWKACAEKLAGGLSNFLFELGDEADEQDVDALKEFYLLLKVNK